MPHVRLIGLVLFITTVFLAMAAAATKTTHIRFERLSPRFSAESNTVQHLPNQAVPGQSPLVLPPDAPYSLPDSDDQPGWSGESQAPGNDSEDELRFVAVPVIYPLLVAAAVGLGLWFVPAPQPRSKANRKRRRRRR